MECVYVSPSSVGMGLGLFSRLLFLLLGAEVFDVDIIKVVSKVGIEQGLRRCTYTLHRGWKGREGRKCAGLSWPVLVALDLCL